MAIRYDTAQLERRYLLDMLDVSDCRILEIGCGDGRLTWQYAELADYVVGIDVALDDVRQGLDHRPDDLTDTVDLLGGSSIVMPFADASFDHVIFAWSF